MYMEVEGSRNEYNLGCGELSHWCLRSSDQGVEVE